MKFFKTKAYFFGLFFLIQHKVFCASLQEYNGPKIVAKDIEMIYSEKAIVKAKIISKVAQTYNNGNQLFPKGVFVEFYNEENKITATLSSNFVRYDAKKNIYFLKNNVKVNNIKRNERLETEELVWDPVKKKIHTERYVDIFTNDITLRGYNGIDAEQDLSAYTILKPKGDIAIKNIKASKPIENTDKDTEFDNDQSILEKEQN